MALSKDDFEHLMDNLPAASGHPPGIMPPGPPGAGGPPGGPPIPPVLIPFAKDRMGPCSYDLSVGDQYYLYHDEDGQSFRPRLLPTGSDLVIPRNSCAFVMTEEFVNMPNFLMGLVALRFELTKQGIMLSPQAPIDPGFKGKIMMMIYNLSDDHRYLRRGQPFVTISFHRMDTPASHGYAGSNQGITDLINYFPQTRGPIKTSLTASEELLKAKATELERQMKEVQDARGRVITTVLGIAAIVVAVAALLAALLPLIPSWKDGELLPSDTSPSQTSPQSPSQPTSQPPSPAVPPTQAVNPQSSLSP